MTKFFKIDPLARIQPPPICATSPRATNGSQGREDGPVRVVGGDLLPTFIGGGSRVARASDAETTRGEPVNESVIR